MAIPRGSGNLVFTVQDEEFLQQFEQATFPLAQWHHREHIKLAYLYCLRHGPDEAGRKLRRYLQAYIKAQGVTETPTSGYHETMTQAWLRLVNVTLEEYGPQPTSDEFYEFHPQLHEKKALRLFYSADLYLSPRAKQAFLEPDLTALPEARRHEDSYDPAQQWPV